VTLDSTSLAARAEALGFLACGVASLEPSQRAGALDDWLARGYAGTMRYLHRQAKKRKQPALIVPGARVAVVVLEHYLSPSDAAGSPAGARIAKYARGEDYHRALTRRLSGLADFLRGHGASVAHPWVDSGPVPERELAERAGLGWIGKNAMLIRPGAGSYFFIGTVFTDLDLEPGTPLATDHCGSCTRCLDACPTDAFVEPRVLDATRCISYLTIEWKKAFPADLATRLDGWAFGCDVCNDVCPWNDRFSQPSPRSEYAARPVPDTTDPGYFDRMDQVEFERLFGDSPLARPGLVGMRRNWREAFRTGRHSAPTPQGSTG
jgi:epoxyqueuosine reductase